MSKGTTDQSVVLHLTSTKAKVPHLTKRSQIFFANVAGFLQSKRALDATAKQSLPQKWMEQHAAFQVSNRMVQKNDRGEKVTNLDELFKVASIAKPKFDKLMQDIVKASGLNPDEEIRIHGEALKLDNKNVFHVLSLAPLKGSKRCLEKVTNEYSGDYSRLVDVVRCSIVVYTEEQLEIVAQALARGTSHCGYTVIRLKNRFRTPSFSGYRDALYSIEVDCENGACHVCEVQLHLAPVVAHKEQNHIYYEYFRSYFGGSGAEEERMKALEKLRGFDGNMDSMIASAMQETDVGQLRALGYLFNTLMGELHVTAEIYRRLFELESSALAKHEYALALQHVGRYTDAENLLRECLDETIKQFGERHRETAVTRQNLGTCLLNQHKYAAVEECYAASFLVLGESLDNPHETMIAGINYATALNHGGKYLQAEGICRIIVTLSGSTSVRVHALSVLVAALQHQGKYKEAEPLFQEVLTKLRQLYGEDHAHYLHALKNTGDLFLAQDNLVEVEKFYCKTLAIFQEQLGDSPDTLNMMGSLAAVLEKQGRLQQAEVLLRKAFELSREVLGMEHPSTLSLLESLSNQLLDKGELEAAEDLLSQGQLQYASEEIPLEILASLANLRKEQGKLQESCNLVRKVFDRRKYLFGTSHPATLESMNDLTALLLDQQELKEAENLCQKTLEGWQRRLRSSSSITLTSLINRGRVLQAKNDVKQAEIFFHDTLRTLKEVLGVSHSSTLHLAAELVTLLHSQNKLEEAEQLARECLPLTSRLPLEKMMFMELLGLVLRLRGKLLEAEKTFCEALDGRRELQGNSHRQTLAAKGNLAIIYVEKGKFSEAKKLANDTVVAQRKLLGKFHLDTLTTLITLASIHRIFRELEAARKLCEEAVREYKERLGAKNLRTLKAMHLLGYVMFEQGEVESAERLLKNVWEQQKLQLGESHPCTLGSLNILAGVQRRQGKLTAAEVSWKQCFQEMKKSLGCKHPHTLLTIYNYATVLEDQAKLREAEIYFNFALTEQRKVLTDDHLHTQNTIRRLVLMLARQNKRAEIEKLLDLGISHTLLKSLISPSDSKCVI